MPKSLLLSSLTAAGLAFALGACDEQQASDSAVEPMQQQGAMPSEENDAMPAATESMEPATPESGTTMPQSETPATNQ
jgi:hypothetical protein